MKIRSVKCATCDHWHPIRNGVNHCPVCGTNTTIVNRKHVHWVIRANKVLTVCRAVPRFQMTDWKLRRMGYALAERS